MIDYNLMREKLGKSTFKGRLLSLDPGETTGCAVFSAQDKVSLLYADQLPGWPLEDGVPALTKVIQQYAPDFMVHESYHVYKWQLEQHTFSQIPTVQIIGAYKTLCIQYQIPYTEQTAAVGKGLCTNDKLEAWGFWKVGMKHARDAIRHGCHYLLFNGQ